MTFFNIHPIFFRVFSIIFIILLKTTLKKIALHEIKTYFFYNTSKKDKKKKKSGFLNKSRIKKGFIELFHYFGKILIEIRDRIDSIIKLL